MRVCKNVPSPRRTEGESTDKRRPSSVTTGSDEMLSYILWSEKKMAPGITSNVKTVELPISAGSAKKNTILVTRTLRICEKPSRVLVECGILNSDFSCTTAESGMLACWWSEVSYLHRTVTIINMYKRDAVIADQFLDRQAIYKAIQCVPLGTTPATCAAPAT